MRRVIWADPAVADLHAIRAYLSEHGEELARDTAARIVLAARFLLQHPGAGTPVRGRWRKWRVPRTRYLLLYQATRDGISIGRVRHDRSDWRLVPE
jgi:toxin ParE1/3/4